MKRGPGPQRKTPLTSSSELPRGAGLARGQALQRSAPMPRSPPNDDGKPKRPRSKPAAPESVLKLVRARDGDQCVGCGAENVHLETHHRRRKGMGGSKLLDRASNLIRLCGHGNIDGCHGWAHQHRVKAEATGLMVPEGVEPATWAVKYADGGWTLLDDLGHRTPTGPYGASS